MPDQVLITDDNYSPIVSILAILGILLVSTSAVGRLFTKISMRAGLNWEDVTIITSFIFAGGQTAAILVAGANGLGSRGANYRNNPVAEKAFYASNLLFIPSVVFSKIAVDMFMLNMIPIVSHRRFAYRYLYSTSAWGVASVVAAALVSGVKRPWSCEAGVCFDLPFWDAFGAINILTDLILVVWPIMIVGKLKSRSARRYAVVACFCLRLLSIGGAISQLVLQQRLLNAIDVTFSIWQTSVCIQIIQSTSLIAACAPYLITFFGSLVSGMLRPDDQRRQLGEYEGQPRRFNGAKVKTALLSMVDRPHMPEENHDPHDLARLSGIGRFDIDLTNEGIDGSSSPLGAAGTSRSDLVPS